MTPQKTYALCCEATRGLVRGIDREDLRLIEKQLQLLKRYLEKRDAREAAALRGEELLRSEQLDALEGITDEMQKSLRLMRHAAREQFERLRSNRSLLTHLTACSYEPDPAVPVC